jgi:hypothetical protein
MPAPAAEHAPNAKLPGFTAMAKAEKLTHTGRSAAARENRPRRTGLGGSVGFASGN